MLYLSFKYCFPPELWMQIWCALPWTNIWKIRFSKQNQNVELMIAMPLGLNASGSQSMCVTLSKLWVGGKDQDKLWFRAGRNIYCCVLIIVAFLTHILGLRIFKQDWILLNKTTVACAEVVFWSTVAALAVLCMPLGYIIPLSWESIGFLHSSVW